MKNYLILALVILTSIGFVSAYNGDFCNSTNTPCSLTGNATSICTSTDLTNMYLSYDFNIDSLDVGDISGWNTSCIVVLTDIFALSNFNQPIGSWDTRNVVYMGSVFYNDANFNQDISNWNTSSAVNMAYMFAGATSFNQSINSWDVSQVTDMQSMFSGVNLSSANYDALLNGWSGQIVQSNVVFDGGFSEYTTAGVGGRNILVNNFIWTITDGGLNCVENWSQDSHPSCDGILPSYNISYTDQSMCGTINNLPVDNGTVFVCCVESWVQDLPSACNGILPSFNITYSDVNVCNTSFQIPVNNGTVVSCCVESWVQFNSSCIANFLTSYYLDSNSCNTSFQLPVNNGSIVSCSELVGGQYRGGSGSQEVIVPQSALPSTTTTIPATHGALYNVWQSIMKFFSFEWLTKWWSGG